MWNEAKVVLKGKFVALNVYIIKDEVPQINYISNHISYLEKKQIKLKIEKKGNNKDKNRIQWNRQTRNRTNSRDN